MTISPAPQAIHAEDINETDVVRLRDSSLVTVRPVRATDEPALHLFLTGLCVEARRLRFFTGAADMRSAAHVATDVCVGHFGLVAHDETGVLVAHALYIQLDRSRAEVAVEVADHLHGRGLGTILIERLAMIAEQHGITRFVAEVLSENHAMLDVFREGFDGRIVRQDGPEKTIEFLTSGWRLARERLRSN